MITLIHLHCICTVFAPFLHCICTIISMYLHHVCAFFALYLHHILNVFAPFLHCIFTLFVLCLHRICSVFVPHLRRNHASLVFSLVRRKSHQSNTFSHQDCLSYNQENLSRCYNQETQSRKLSGESGFQCFQWQLESLGQSCA